MGGGNAEGGKGFRRVVGDIITKSCVSDVLSLKSCIIMCCRINITLLKFYTIFKFNNCLQVHFNQRKLKQLVKKKIH